MSLTLERGRGADLTEVTALRPVGRTGALLVLLSVGIHLVPVFGREHAVTTVVVHVVMAAVCLPCAICLWSRPSANAWRVLAIMALGMVMIHAFWLGSSGTTAAHAHHAESMAGGLDAGLAIGMLCAVIEWGLAAWVLSTSALEKPVA